MIIKLVSGEELIVVKLLEDSLGDSFIVSKPYIILRQIVQNVPCLYLSKWISYAGSDTFIIRKQAIMSLGIPNQEIMKYYNSSLEEEVMIDDNDKITTSQISTSYH
jgi:hypothetical protein